MEDQSSQEVRKRKLSPKQYRVLVEKGTEPAFSGKLLYNKEKGIYSCAACSHELFSSDSKFDSGCGWPSFFQPKDNRNINETNDFSHGMRRIEVTCAHCGGHLGHVFPDGPKPTGLRYCINSTALEFKKKG